MGIYYIADIEQDIDDIIAIDYLHHTKYLEAVVLDPQPTTEMGLERVRHIQAMGINILDNLPYSNINVVINGGAFTKLAKHLERGSINLLFSNGGFVSNDHMPIEQRLQKFEGKKEMRTYNFNIDVINTIKVLKSNKINRHYLIGKNVCHNERNTIKQLWGNIEILKKYKLKQSKRLHDLLVCVEAIRMISGGQSLLTYRSSKPYHRGIEGNRTQWGTHLVEESNILSAIKYNV